MEDAFSKENCIRISLAMASCNEEGYFKFSFRILVVYVRFQNEIDIVIS